MPPGSFSPDERFAGALDAADPIARYRGEFHIPTDPDGTPVVYLVGNSLGLMPRAARALVDEEMEDWARFGVEGHFAARHPWYRYHELLRESGARLVGALPGEVVWMNSVTVNLHLMLTSFYRPRPGRSRVLIEDQAFPSDQYAIASHVEARGLDPDAEVVTARPRSGESILRTEDIVALLKARGGEFALIMLGAVNYYTGQWFDMARITEAGHRQGCLVGWDLAHAVGNVPLTLHDWDTDFAVWCSYKYLNGGPGAVGGCFIHQRHGADRSSPRLGGWWGNDPATRFEMRPEFVPTEGADGWQLSNPPILSMAPLRASLDLFDRAGMAALRQKSESLTGYLVALLADLPTDRLSLLTSTRVEERGCQLSLHAAGRGRMVHEALRRSGIVTDYREPDVVRLAPVPLYNTYHEVWRTARAIREVVGART
jgi:kynureninase